MTDNDRTILRDLARRYMEVCSKPEIDERRDLWRQHNSLKWTRPLIYVRAFAWKEMPEAQLAVRGSRSCAASRTSSATSSSGTAWATTRSSSRGSRCRRPIAARAGASAASATAQTRSGGSFKVDYPAQATRGHREAAAALARDRRGSDRARRRPAGGRHRRHHHDQRRPRPGLSHVDRRHLHRPGLPARHRELHARHVRPARVAAPAGRLHARRHPARRTSRPRRPATGACARTRTRPCPTPRSCPTRRPTPTACGASSCGATWPRRSSPLVSPAMHDEFLLQYQLPILKPVRPGRLRLLRGPDPQDRHAAPDPEPAPHRRLALRQRGPLRRADRPRTTCSATAPARPTWWATASIQSASAPSCAAICRRAGRATPTSR